MGLKIALFNDSFPPTIDGVANAMLNYATIINSKFGKAVVVTPKYPNVVDHYPFEVYRYASINFGSQIPYRVGNPFSPITISELNNRNFDLLHVHCPFASAVLAHELTIGRNNKKPMIFTYHTKFDIDLDRFVPNRQFNKISRNFILRNINNADEVWAVSEGAIESLRNIGYQGDVLVMPNGTDFKRGKASSDEIAELERMYRVTPDELIFLFVGRMMWYKNIKLILDALKIVQDAEIAFRTFFVGDGPDRPSIEQYAREIGIYEKTIFTGAIYDRERLRAFFSRASLFLFPSTYDTSGLVVKEAAACDCAAILTRGSCASEGVVDMVSGLLAEENAESCAKKIIGAVRTPGFLERLGKEAAEKVYLSWEDSVTAAYRRYEVVVDRFLKKQNN